MRSDIVPAYLIAKSFLAAVPISTYASRRQNKNTAKLTLDKRKKMEKVIWFYQSTLAKCFYAAF